MNKLIGQIGSGVEDSLVRIKALEDDRRTRKLGMGVPGGPAGKSSRFSLAKAIVGLGMAAQGKDVWKEIGGEYEQRVIQAATQRRWTPAQAEPVVVTSCHKEELAGEFIELLYANSVCIRAGARVLTNLKGSPVLVSKQLTSANVYWVGQNATITKSDITLGNISLTPRTMAIRAQYSNLLQLLSNPNIETIVRTDFARLAAVELDRVILLGAGTLEPVGLANTPSIGTLALGPDGDYLDWDDLTDMQGYLEDRDAMPTGGSFAYVMVPKVKRRLKKLRIPQFSGDTGGQYIMPPIISDRVMEDMLGYPLYTTTQLRTNLTKGSGTDLSELFFANWQDVYVGMWGGLEILASNVAGDAWAQNAVEIRLIQNVDVSVRNLESVVYMNDARTV